jgi:hypothetical protein
MGRRREPRKDDDRIDALCIELAPRLVRYRHIEERAAAMHRKFAFDDDDLARVDHYVPIESR